MIFHIFHKREAKKSMKCTSIGNTDTTSAPF